jgi:hypothetical protein
MSEKRKNLWLFFLMLIYVAIAAAGFCIAYFVKIEFFSKHFATAQSIKQITTKTSPIPVGWKTYTNKNYQFTFSYPPTDKVVTKLYGFNVSSIALQNIQGGPGFQILLLPKNLASAVGQDFDSYYTMPNNTSKVIKSPLSQDNESEKFTKIDTSTVNGLRALDYTSTSSNTKPGAPEEIGTFIEIGSNLVLISTEENNRKQLNEMISSFKYPL